MIFWSSPSARLHMRIASSGLSTMNALALTSAARRPASAPDTGRGNPPGPPRPRRGMARLERGQLLHAEDHLPGPRHHRLGRVGIPRDAGGDLLLPERDGHVHRVHPDQLDLVALERSGDLRPRPLPDYPACGG